MSEYSKAKSIILDTWRMFRENANEFLPDYAPISKDDDLRSKYQYYDEVDANVISWLQKDYRSFGELISKSVIGDHCRGRIHDQLLEMDDAVKNKNVDDFLLSIYTLFCTYREMIIVLERCPF